MLDTNDPRVTVRVGTQQAKIAAGVDHALTDTALLERCHGLINSVTFGNATEVEAACRALPSRTVPLVPSKCTSR